MKQNLKLFLSILFILGIAFFEILSMLSVLVIVETSQMPTPHITTLIVSILAFILFESIAIFLFLSINHLHKEKKAMHYEVNPKK